MNNDIYMLFARLCDDLGLRPSDRVTMSQLQEARNALLLAAESVGTDGYWNSGAIQNWWQKFSMCFMRVDRRYARPWRPTVFRDAYQAVSFPLKVETEYTPQQERSYIEKFLQNEESCRNWRLADYAHTELLRLARYCVRLASKHWCLDPEALIGSCRHGPGAVSQGYRGVDKNVFTPIERMPYQLTSWCGDRLFYANDRMRPLPDGTERCFWFDDSDMIIGGNTNDCVCNLADEGCTRSVRDRIVARLNLVPKDWKGPRGVFISPAEAMWAQLGIWETIRLAIPRTWLSACYDPLSQVPSQEACYQGSITRSVATLDLSDASDRIPAVLVKYLFPAQDWAAFSATRPSAVELPDGSLHKLYMFSPMGDGKTFPILTIVCSAISMAAILIDRGYVAARPPTEAVLRRLASNLRVFGDDIIVPTENYARVCACLESCNLKVNVQKSYSKGYFRESCGLDAYKGLDCTPLRLRFNPMRRPDLATAQKAVDLHNRIWCRRPDLRSTLMYLERYVQRSKWKTGYTRYPNMCPTLLACYADEFLKRNIDGCGAPFAINIALQRFEVRTLVEEKAAEPLKLNPWWDLNHWLLTAGGPRSESPFVSERSVASISTIADRQWFDLCSRAGVNAGRRLGCRSVWVAAY